MAVTKTSIVSLALFLLGHAPITSLENADDITNAALQVFDVLLPSVLATGNWRFAIQIQQLSQSAMTPPPQTGWQNIYLLPSGYLKNIRVIPENFNYEIYQSSQIWCNWGTETPIYMEYAFLPDVSQLPAPFINYFIYEIAAFLSLSNAQKPEYYNVLEQKRINQLAIAAAQDAQNRPQMHPVIFPALNNRNITGIIGNQIG